MILWMFSAFVALVLYATRDVLRSIFGPRFRPSPLQNLKGPNNGTLVLGHTRGFKGVSVQPERWIMRVFEKFGPVTVIRGQFNVSWVLLFAISLLIYHNRQAFYRRQTLKPCLTSLAIPTSITSRHS